MAGSVTARYSGPGMGVAVARFSNGTPLVRTTPGPVGGLSFALADGGSDDEGGGPAHDSDRSTLVAESARVRYRSAPVSRDCRCTARTSHFFLLLATLVH